MKGRIKAVVRYRKLLFIALVAGLFLCAGDAHRAFGQATANSLGGLLQGEPVTGKGTGGSGQQATSQPVFIDATQFQDIDMCASIADACGALTSAPVTGFTYPAGAVIDARGFTGNQVCKATNVTTMLSQCVTHKDIHGTTIYATGGKLLLGEVNIYADGPASGNYTDGKGSGIGTPALVIPNGFWGIEGLSRGGSIPSGGTTALGTWISVCTGGGTPVGTTLPPAPGSPSCTTAFPQRVFTISQTTVAACGSGLGGATCMTITASGLTTANVYAGELGMVKAGISSNNGMYKVQSNAAGSITVVVPSGTSPCSSGCGSLWLGTPIVGFGNGGSLSDDYYNGPCSSDNCPAFGEHIKNIGFNCQADGGTKGCMGWQNLYAQENSDVDNFLISDYNFAGFDTHGALAQNFGPISNGEIYTGLGNTTCGSGTTGGYIGDTPMRGLNGWSVNTPAQSGGAPSSPCSNQPATAIMLDALGVDVRNGHCENYLNCVLLGANVGTNGNAYSSAASAQRIGPISGPDGSSRTAASIVHISGNYPLTGGLANTNMVIEGISRNAQQWSIKDDLHGASLTDNNVSLYNTDSSGGVLTNSSTTSLNTAVAINNGTITAYNSSGTNVFNAGPSGLSVGGGALLTSTNQTGTGNLVLANSATLTSPTLNTATLTSPTMTTPTLGVASGTTLSLGGGTPLATTNQSGTGNLVLANNAAIGTPTLTSPKINGGIANNGSGFQTVRMTSCVPGTAANSTCNNTVTWATSFGTTAYTMQCSLTTSGGTGTTIPLWAVLVASSKSASGANVGVTNGPLGGTVSATLECTAVHD